MRLIRHLAFVLLLVSPVLAAEQLTLTTPETKPTNPAYTVERLVIDVAAKTVLVTIRGANGEAKSFAYTDVPSPSGKTGAQLITALNTANLTTTSLVKRIFLQLAADGYLAGTVAGTPD